MSESLPAHLARRIRADYIDNGVVQPGQRLPSVRDMKRIYQTSNTTLVNALSVIEAQGAIRKVHGKGCYVTEQTERNTGEHKDFIGFIMPTAISTGCMMRFYAGVESGARAAGCDLLVASADYDYDRERYQVKCLMDRGCRGIVMCPVTRLPSQLEHDFLATDYRDFPIVLVDIAYPEQKRSQVVFDNYRAGYQMTRLLLDHGHEHIAFMQALLPDGTPVQHRSTADRYRGYLNALHASGLQPRPEDIWAASLIIDDHGEETVRLLRQWREQDEPATAVMALTDDVALDLLHVASSLGIDVPGELQVTGFDNLRPARSLRPPFPTTDPNFEHAGELAVEVLFRQMEENIEPSITYMLDVPLIRTSIPSQTAGVCQVS